jgi:hypothetical protein
MNVTLNKKYTHSGFFIENCGVGFISNVCKLQLYVLQLVQKNIKNIYFKFVFE